LSSDLAFDWDDANRDHIARHQVSSEEAEQVIDNDPLDLDAQTFDGEERTPSIGRTDRGRFLVVITTLRDCRIRVVTAFPAPKSLIDLYYSLKGA
jgi:uncharacterized protein